MFHWQLLTAVASWLCLLICVAVILGLFALYFTTNPMPNLQWLDGEKTFLDPASGQRKNFPTIQDNASVYLSVIVPSYNEEERLPPMMDEALEYMEARRRKDPLFKYEVIVVNDGSTDKTTEVALRYSQSHGTEKVRVLSLKKNRGKGGAVRRGMLCARGRLLLFADADGATKFSDIEKLENEVKNMESKLKEQGKTEDQMLVVCGSRAHLEKQSIAQRSIFRTILMYGFHFAVWFLCVRGVKDTQCGFKLLTRPAAMLLFHNMHVDRWAFDVDLLYLAQHFRIPISEVAVTWHEIEGSKVTPFWSWLQMGRDLVLIRLRYLLGLWHISDKPKIQ